MKISPKGVIIASCTVISAACIGILSQQKSPAAILHANYEQAVRRLVTPTPSTQPIMQVTSVHSPDGTMKLVMRREQRFDGRIAYTFRTFAADNTDHLLYETTLPIGDEMRTPDNSWSPDNRYVFIIHRGPFDFTALVFRANGAPIGDNTQYLDVNSLFKDKISNLTLRDVTGWDDPGLLHIFTYNADKSKGPSYWFEIYDSAFIGLANR